MAKRMLLCLMLAALGGCQTMSPAQSSAGAAGMTAPAEGKAIALDVVKKLVVLYPPARTRFDLRQTASDNFGRALVEQMRSKGYAIEEYKPASALKPPQLQAATGTNGAAPVTSFAYFIDQAGDSGIYRVTLTIDRHTLIRAYQAGAGGVSPASYWVRKE
jgi:hypothetical protein